MPDVLKTPPLPGLLTANALLGAKGSTIASELVSFENGEGKRIVGFHDFSKGGGNERPWILVLPGYGETKTDVLTVSYFLAKNGFHALRFDYTDHVGESDGEILSTTLTTMKNDVRSALDYLYRRFRPAAVGAVGSSLASRALLRAAKEDQRIRLLLNMVSVVDVRKTLHAIYQEDYFRHAHNGVANGVMDVLGFQVDADHFLRSAIQDRYEDLLTTMEDARQIDIPMVFFAAENDAWVEMSDVQQVLDAAGSREKKLFRLKGTLHRLYENPQAVKETLKRMAEYSGRYLMDHRVCVPVEEPNLKEVGVRIRKEKERNRILHAVSREEEREFWKSYLEKYSFVINVHDYWNMLDFICRLLGDPIRAEKVLDAGCGIGNYGTVLLLKLLYRLRQSLFPASGTSGFCYVGVDFVREAIVEAKATHDRIRKEFFSTMGLSAQGERACYSYFLADLDSGLPFESRSFDQVCCNLVVSYLQDPVRVVGELVRLLKSKGRIVLTSLKPFADLSEIYRNFVRVAANQGEIEEARKLLTNAGRVKAKEAEGVYHFFSEEALMDLLKEAGLRDIESFRSFGNQANVAVGIKG